MAPSKLRPSTLRLHGEDGRVFITDRNGVKLWEVRMREVKVSECCEGGAFLAFKALGYAPEP